MKILVISTFDISLRAWHDKGILDRELLVYKRMVSAGWKIGILTHGDERDLGFKKYTEGIEVFPIYSYIKKPGNRFIRFLVSFTVPFKLAFIFRDYDIYKTNQMLGAWVGVLAKILYGKKLLVRCGYEWLRNSFRESNIFKKVFVIVFGWPCELFTYMISDRIVVSSEVISGFIKRVFFQGQYKIKLIPNFVDVDTFRKLDVSGFHKKKILYIGRINKVKNLANLITAVKDSGLGLGLDIIGSGDSREELKQYAEGADVRFLGNIPNSQLPAYINRYPVFALVSLFENNPKSLLEAMACERAVVASDRQGLRELIKDNTSGILVSTDVEGIKSGIGTAFRLSKEERERLGIEARNFVVEKASLEKIYKEESSLCEELLRK